MKSVFLTEEGNIQMLPLDGYIYNVGSLFKSQRVQGFAFQIPGMDWLHLWLTPSIEEGQRGLWNVSHWETGACILMEPVEDKQRAMRAAIGIVKERGEAATKEAINKWFRGTSWPGK